METREYESAKEYHCDQSREEESNRDEKRIKRLKLKHKAIRQNANLKKKIVDRAINKEEDKNLDDMSTDPPVQES